MEVGENKYLKYFLNKHLKDSSFESMDSQSFEALKIKYRNRFLCGKEEFDTLYDIWCLHGLFSYNNGLFSLVNPDEYSPIAKKFPNISETALVFAKTCMGGLFIFDNLPAGKSILYVNVHKGKRKIVSTDFDVFFANSTNAESFWKRECYGKFELKVIEKYGPLAYDECYAFVPALTLGGSESIKSIQKVKVKEHLEFLSQLY